MAESNPGINLSEQCLQAKLDQLNDLKMRLEALQGQINELEQAIQASRQVSENEQAKSAITVGQLREFLKDNAFNIISLACTLTGLYMSYYFNHENLKMSQASFLIDKGEVALKNLWMVAKRQYAQYRALASAIKA